MTSTTPIPQFRNRTTVAYNADDMEWQTDAKCRDHDPETWFPERGGIAIALKSQYGVWAGTYLGTTSNTRATARRRLLVIADINEGAEVAS